MIKDFRFYFSFALKLSDITCNMENLACKKCDDNKKCLECFAGYELVDGACEEIECKIDGCDICNTPNICSKCLEDKKLSVDGTSCGDNCPLDEFE